MQIGVDLGLASTWTLQLADPCERGNYDRATEFKRLRFFTGFFTTARDWEAEQNYHLEKLKLHNGGLHTPGIIHAWGRNWMSWRPEVSSCR